MADDRKNEPSWVNRVGRGIGNVLTSKPVVVGAAALAGAAAAGAGAEYLFSPGDADQHTAISDIVHKVQEGGWLSSPAGDVVNVPDHPYFTVATTPGAETHFLSSNGNIVSVATNVDAGQVAFTNDSKTALTSLINSNAVSEAVANGNKDLGSAITAFNSDLATDGKVSKEVYDTLLNKLGGIQGWNVGQFAMDNPPPGYFGYTAPDNSKLGEYAGKQIFFRDDLVDAFKDKNQGVVDFLNYASAPVHTSGIVAGTVGGLAAGAGAAGIKDESNHRAAQELREDPNFWRAQIAEELAASQQQQGSVRS